MYCFGNKGTKNRVMSKVKPGLARLDSPSA